MIFTNPQPTDYVQRIAERGVLARHFVPAILARQRRAARLVLALVERLTPGRRLLDFGCGEGVLVHEARQRGWHSVGLDLNHGLVAAANVHWGFDALMAGTLDELSRRGPDRYDVIISSQVFEHLQRPLETGRQAVSLLKPGGLLYLDVPNVRQLGERLARGKTLDPTAHWNHFSLSTLHRLVVRLGCAPVYASGAPSLVELYARLGFARFTYTLGRLSKRLLPAIGTGACVIARVPPADMSARDASPPRLATPASRNEEPCAGRLRFIPPTAQ
jgi:SAM-dependent methyltransferase